MIKTAAWVSGSGHTSGIYGVTGLAECDVIPYLNGGLTHPDGHSKIVGIAIDGYPIYGPYGYSTSTSAGSGVRRMTSGYALNPTFVSNGARTTNGTTPTVNAQFPLGMFVEDWSFVGGGDLDTHNGRYCVTPEYPSGTYAYFLTFDVDGGPIYPYVIGNTYYGTAATLAIPSTTTTTTTTAAPTTTTTTTAAPTTTSTTTLAPGQTTTTSTSTTSTSSTSTTTTAAPPDCIEYFCRAANGGYIYWTDCVTGKQSSVLLNGGKVKHIFSTTYPEKEKGANVSIKMIP
jgi:hypothetical protein